MGPIALSLADTADVQSSVLRTRVIDPQLALTRWLKGLQCAWTRHHRADRFMWMEGAVGVAEAFSGGEMHGYLTFCSNAQAVAACAVVSVALGTVAPQPGQVPAWPHGVYAE